GPDSNTSESIGKITDVLTEPGRQAGRNVNASMEDPRYEIENTNTGKTSTIYKKNIIGIEKILSRGEWIWEQSRSMACRIRLN
ncbi:hypothetical protein B0H66DRAFT_480858, partial [Apodospora peruviana]